MALISLVVQILVATVFARCIHLRYFHPLSRYPGPFLASFTNLWKFFNFLSGGLHQTEESLHAKHGPVVRTGPQSLSFASLPAYDAIYGFNKSIEKGDHFNFARDFRPGPVPAESVFSARTDAAHRAYRRNVIGSAFLSGHVATYQPVVSKNVAVLLARLDRERNKEQQQQQQQQAKGSHQATVEINIEPAFRRFAFDTFLEVIWGSELGPHPFSDRPTSAGALKAVAAAGKFRWAASMVPALGWLMTTKFMTDLLRRPKFGPDGKALGFPGLMLSARSLVEDHSDEARDSPQPSVLRNFLRVPEDDPKHMDQDQIRRECNNVTFAGGGSGAAALIAVLNCLGSEPSGLEWQRRIRNASSPSPSSSSPVLLAVMKESLRLHSPFSTSFPREIVPGAENAIPNLPAPLPAGTLVGANSYVISRSREVWGADAQEWKPERWLDDEEDDGSENGEQAGAPARRKWLEDRFLAFGKGARGCAGKELAMATLEKAIWAVLDKWNIKAVRPLVGSSWLETNYKECLIGLTEMAHVDNEVS